MAHDRRGSEQHCGVSEGTQRAPPSPTARAPSVPVHRAVRYERWPSQARAANNRCLAQSKVVSVSPVVAQGAHVAGMGVKRFMVWRLASPQAAMTPQLYARIAKALEALNVREARVPCCVWA